MKLLKYLFLFSILTSIPLLHVSAKELSLPIEMIVLGADSRTGLEYIEELKNRSDVHLAALVLSQKEIPKELRKLGIPLFVEGEEDQLLQSIDFDAALIASPDEQELLIGKLLVAGKYVMKENPLAFSSETAYFYQNLVATQNVPPIFTILLRQMRPAFLQALELLPLLGKPIDFRYEYSSLSEKASPINARGVVKDIGYPIVDLIQSFFGVPLSIMAGFFYKSAETQLRGLEDEASVCFDYGPDIQGMMILNRNSDHELFSIDGPDGSLVITPDGYQFVYHSTSSLSFLDYRIEQLPMSQAEAIGKMFDLSLSYRTKQNEFKQAFEHNIKNVEIVDEIYRQHMDVVIYH